MRLHRRTLRLYALGLCIGTSTLLFLERDDGTITRLHEWRPPRAPRAGPRQHDPDGQAPTR